MIKFKKAYPLLSVLFPSVAAAQNITAIINGVRDTLFSVIAFLFVLAALIFVWGMVKYIAHAGNEAERIKSKGIMTWGILGLAVMTGVWGIVNILLNYFGLGGERIPTVPAGW